MAESHEKTKVKEQKQIGYIPRLKVKFREEIIPQMMEEFSYSNSYQVPRFEKVIVNMGIGEASQESKVIEEAIEDLKIITGQKPLVTKAKKSIAGFKVKGGTPIGLKVTLRGNRMYEFLDRLISLALPRIRDFKGLSKNSFDGRGNYTLGVDEQLIFPEVDYDKVSKVLGMDITIVTTARSNEEGFSLLKRFGFLFRER